MLSILPYFKPLIINYDYSLYLFINLLKFMLKFYQNAINLDYCPYVTIYRTTGNLQPLIILIIIILHTTLRPYLLKDFLSSQSHNVTSLCSTNILMCSYSYFLVGLPLLPDLRYLCQHKCFFFLFLSFFLPLFFSSRCYY